MSFIVDWVETHWAISICAAFFLFQFLSFLYDLISNRVADKKIESKLTALEADVNQKKINLDTEYHQLQASLWQKHYDDRRNFETWQKQCTAEIDEKYQQVTMMKKLHLLCTQDSFLFDKTAIDDTLLKSDCFARALSDDIKIVSPVSITAEVKGISGIYHTSLRSCSCPDFQARKNPCKHMYKLAMHIGLLTSNPDSPKRELLRTEKLLNEHYVKQYDELYRKCQQKYREIDHIVNATSAQYPWLAKLYADYQYICDGIREQGLRKKSRPALKAADEMHAIRIEKRTLQKQNKLLEYQLHCYQSLFPWLEDFNEVSPTEVYDEMHKQAFDEKSEYDAVMKNWLSPEEYAKLPNVQKYQLALDRYKVRKKTNWQVGIEYERYIGYLYETKGYSVHYQGALMGLEDMGRDLIADNGAELLVVQCKRWAKEKQIHENHIFQLYGTMILLTIQNPRIAVKGVFVTSTELSQVAKSCAKYLNIEVREKEPLKDYPLIKCNVSRNNEKIYHLPMDLQYDRTIISPHKGDCYVETVAEAERLGFRRAYRWSGSNSN